MKTNIYHYAKLALVGYAIAAIILAITVSVAAAGNVTPVWIERHPTPPAKCWALKIGNLGILPCSTPPYHENVRDGNPDITRSGTPTDTPETPPENPKCKPDIKPDTNSQKPKRNASNHNGKGGNDGKGGKRRDGSRNSNR